MLMVIYHFFSFGRTGEGVRGGPRADQRWAAGPRSSDVKRGHLSESTISHITFVRLAFIRGAVSLPHGEPE